MNLYFNPRSAILLAVFIQAAVTAFLIFQRGQKCKKQSDKLLSSLLFFLGLSLTDFIIGFLGFYVKYPGLTFFPFENLFAISALLYLYSLSLLQNDKPNKNTILKHLAIPIIYFSLHFVVYSISTNSKQEILSKFYFPFFVYLEILLYYIISSYYFVFIIKTLRRHSKIANDKYAQISPAILNWLRYFIYGFVVYLTIDFILSASSALFHFDFEQQYWKYAIRALLTSFLCIAGYNFDEKVSLPNNEFEKFENKTETANEKKVEILNESDLRILKEKTLSYFQQEKPFLDPELNLNQLAKKIDLSGNILSFVINKAFGKNFNDFVNSYRVAEVIEKLKNPANANLTLLSIAFDCGFNSKTTFNRVFKKCTQKLPKEFLSEIKRNST